MLLNRNMLNIDRRATALTPGAGLAFNLALLIVCYGFALQLPLFFDDPPVLSWVDTHTLSDIWTAANENDYYRPLTFTLYWLSGALEPQARAVALHGLNLGLHFVGGCLLMLAARRPE